MKRVLKEVGIRLGNRPRNRLIAEPQKSSALQASLEWCLFDAEEFAEKLP